MARLSVVLWRFCVCLPLIHALSVPQFPFSEELENGVTTVSQDLAFDDAGFDINSCDVGDWNVTNYDYDVAIVGGGPGGLAASMSLSRVARTSILFDSQDYRNAKTRYMHDILGQDGRLYLFKKGRLND